MNIFKKIIGFNNLTPHQLRIYLGLFNRDDLRELARHHGIPRGKNKADTIINLGSNRNKLSHRVVSAFIL